MYPNSNSGQQPGQYSTPPNQQNPQWAPSSNGVPPSSQQGPPQSMPPAWANPPAGYQQQGQGPRSPAPPMPGQAPGQPPAMQAPMQPDPYRSLPPPQPPMYGPPYPGMPYAPAQPAPRQRTAIACRYCRRRKIRCSGFDQSEDGRCTNCQRFSQECVFTPVSAQAQAFVPAHTVYRGQNPPPNTQLYGAYGQPLPHGDNRQPYPPPQQGQYPPPPPGYQQQAMYQQPPGGQMPQQGGSSSSSVAGRKRSHDEPHTPTLPPQQRADGQALYADPDAAPGGLNAEKGDGDGNAQMGAFSNEKEKREMKDVGIQVDLIGAPPK